MPRVPYFTNGRAFLVVELLIALGLFLLVLALIGGSLVAGQQSESFAGGRNRALLLATEGLEASRSIASSNWSNLTPGTFGLATSSGRWVLSTSSDITGGFTRQVIITNLDLKTKRVVSQVSWLSLPAKTESVSLTADVTDWRVSWSATSTEEGGLDLDSGQNAIKIAVSGNYAYIISKAVPQNFTVIAIATPTSPAVVATLSLSNEPKNIAVSGHYAYIASKNNSEELQIISIAIPTAPIQVGVYGANGNADALAVAATGTVVLLGRQDSSQDEFLVINVATPTSPTLLGSLNLNDTNVNEITIIGNYAYLGTGDDDGEEGKLKVVNISNLASPVLAASLDLDDDAEILSVAGFGTIVVVGESSDGTGLAVINVATPTAPTLLGTLAVNGNVNDLALGRTGTHAFLATTESTGEFRVVNLVTPSTPTLLSSFNTSGSLTGVDFHPTQNRVYVVGQDNAAEFMSFKANQP